MNLKTGKYCSALRSQKATLVYMALPSLILVLAFVYVPIYGWVYSFFKYQLGVPFAQSKFMGFKYFELLINNREIVSVLKNTMVISMLIIASSPLPAIFAILVSEIRSKKFRKFIQVTTTLPYFVSWVIIFAVSYAFFSVDDGFINQVLMKIGLITESTKTNLLGDLGAVWYFQAGLAVWKSLGFSAIIYIATITGIDPELFDAAKADGAGIVMRIRHIIIPALIPTYLNLLLIGIGFMLSNGTEQYIVFYNSLVHQNIQVLDYFVYRIGLTTNDYSFATTIGMLKTIVSLGILFTANWISKRLRGQSII